MTRDMRTPLKRARNIGSAKSGAAAWMAMQFTSVVLAGLFVWFVIFVLTLVRADYATARASLAHPVNATLMVAFVIVALWHTELGLRNIYEDYIHTRWLAYWVPLLTRLILLLMAIAAILAVVRIAISR